MPALDPAGFLAVGDQRLEYRSWGLERGQVPRVVLLHEGLASAGSWGPFPEALAKALGLGVLAYSRANYGASSTVPVPRPFSFMHDEALQVLPKVLDAVGAGPVVLIGASDGASIATIYAGHGNDPRVRGLALFAPHFFVEDETVAGAEAGRVAYEQGDLRQKLARWHTHVDAAFNTWNMAFTDPDFRRWNITDALPLIRVPMLVVQGANDQFGTPRQLETADELCACDLETVLMPGVGHSPYRDALDDVLARLVPFVRDALARQAPGSTAPES